MALREVDVLVVGAGIAGLLLARELRARGLRTVVAHDPTRSGASEASVGLLNPVRGRRCTLAWRAAETFAAARETYEAIGADRGEALFRPLSVVRAFASQEERSAWQRRATHIAAAGFTHRERDTLPNGLRPPDHGAVEISGGGAIDARRVIETLREELRAAGMLIELPCDAGLESEASIRFGADTPKLASAWDGVGAGLSRDLRSHRGINPLLQKQPEVTASGGDLYLFNAPELAPGISTSWHAPGIRAQRLVFAGGSVDIGRTPVPERKLRFVKGESLLIRAPGLANQSAYVCGHHLAPVGGDRWMCGGTKVPGVDDASATEAGRAELTDFLNTHLTCPWEAVSHWCGVRAATVDTRAIVGPLDAGGRTLIFNGLGSQGFSSGPWLARLLADHIVSGIPIPHEIHPMRFAPTPAANAGEAWHAGDVARSITEKHLGPGDLAIDLTVGNGGDTLWLAAAVGADGQVLGLDIQPEAIDVAQRRIEHAQPDAAIELRCADHADLNACVREDWRGRVGAVVAHLGLWPGSDSPVATRPESTVRAFGATLPLLRPGGLLVAVVHPTRTGGAEELAAIEQWAASIDATQFQVTWSRTRHGSARTSCVLAVVRRMP